jgi:hypothetical protein
LSYLKQIKEAFFRSFKRGFSFLFVFLYEVVFILSTTVLAFFYAGVLGRIGTSFGSIGAYAITPEATAAVKSFLVNSLLATVVFLLLVLLLYTILQALSWQHVLRTKWSWAFLPRFLLLYLGWLTPWAVIFWFFVAGLRGTYAAYGLTILGILFIHLSFLFQQFVAKGDGFKKSVALTFSIGVGKIHLFLLPYAIGVVIWLLWSQLWRLLPQMSASPFALLAVLCLIFAPLFAWLKFFLSEVRLIASK